MWGYSENGELRVGSATRRQPGPGRGDAGGARGFAGAPLRSGRVLHDRRPADAVEPTCGSVLEPDWGPAARAPARQPHMVIATAAAGGAGPAGAPDAPRASWSRSTRPAWRCTPRRSASHPRSAAAPPSTAPGWPQLISKRLVVRPDRGRPGGLQGRGGRGDAVRLPGPGRLGRPGPARGGAGSAGMAAVVAAALPHIAPVVSLYVNDYNLRRARRTAGSASRRPATFSTIISDRVGRNPRRGAPLQGTR